MRAWGVVATVRPTAGCETGNLLIPLYAGLLIDLLNAVNGWDVITIIQFYVPLML